MMLLIWHETLGTDDEQATEDELCARVLYSYEDCQDDGKMLQTLQLMQGLLAFVRAFQRHEKLMKRTAITEWIPHWASVTLSRRRFFMLEVEPQIYIALGIQPTVEIKDHRPVYEALLREIYGMFRLFHGSIASNLRMLPSVRGGSVESDMTYTDGMDLLMDIATLRKRLRKLQIAIDSVTHDMSCDIGNEDEQYDDKMVQCQEEKRKTEVELEALVALSPAITLQKKCAEFFPTLLQSLDVCSSSAFMELQGLGYFPMDQPTFLSLQSFVNGFYTDLQCLKPGAGTESVEGLALFFKGNLLWNSMETTTMHLLYKFLRLREERGMAMLRGGETHAFGHLHTDEIPSNNADTDLWMATSYEDTYLPVWSSKLSYTECDVVAQSDNGRLEVRKAASLLHKLRPVSLSIFLSEASPSLRSSSRLTPVTTAVAAEPPQSCPPLHSSASSTRHREASRNGMSSARLQSAIKTRAKSASYRNTGVMLKNGCFSKFSHVSREMPSERVRSEIEQVWSPFIFPLDGVFTSIATTTPTAMTARHRVVVWHEADLTLILLLHHNKTDLDSTDGVPMRLNANTIERLEEYLEGQQRFQTLAQLILTRRNATFASKKNIPSLSSLPPFLYINRVNLAFRMQHVPRLLKSKKDDLFPVPATLLVHYFPASATALLNDLHAELHQSVSTGNREICIRTRHAGWVFAKRSETSHRELYVFIDNKMGSSVYDLADSLQMLLHEQFGNVLF